MGVAAYNSAILRVWRKEVKMRYKILFVDIDGTLMYPERKHLTERCIRILKELQSKGVLVIPATGRGFVAIRPQVLGGVVADYSVCCNGACVLNQNGEIIYGHPMSPKQMGILCELARDNNYSLGFSFLDGYYTYFQDAIFREFYRQTNGDMLCLLDGTDHTRHLRDLPYSGWGMVPREKAEEFNKEKNGLVMIPFKNISHDICQSGINKKTGAEQLLTKMGIDWSETVAIGDGDNDCELLSSAGKSIAMGNAVMAAKEVADIIAGDVSEDGASEAIAKIFHID